MAQRHWKNVDSAYGPLPPSMHVYSSRDSIDGHPLQAYYVSVLLKDKQLEFSVGMGKGSRFSPDEYFRLERRPLLLVNCIFSDSDRNLSILIRDGKMLSRNIVSLKGMGKDSSLYYYPTRSAIGIDKKRQADVAWIFTDSLHLKSYAFEDAPVVARGEKQTPTIYDLKDIDWKWWKMQVAVGGGPTLIHDGKPDITDKEEQLYPFREGERQARTAMGYTKGGKWIVLVIGGGPPGKAGGATLKEEAALLLDLGCVEALNLDGGDNSCLLVNGKETNHPSGAGGQQSLPAVFLIRLAEQ